MRQTMRTVPLIGGPRDGSVINIHDGTDSYFVEEYVTFEPPVKERHAYRREKLTGQREQFHVFVAESLPIDAALQKLVKGYRRPRP